MTEHAPHTNHETLTQQAANFELAQDLTSTEALENRRQWLKDQMNGEYDPQMGHVHRLLERSMVQHEESMQAWESIASGELDHKTGSDLRDKKIDQYNKTREMARKTFGNKAVERHHQLQNEEYALSKEQHPVLEFHDGEAETVFANLVAETAVIKDGIDREHDLPPTERIGATGEDFQKYLAKKTFVDRRELRLAENKQAVPIRLFSKNGFTIPTANVVSAGSFENWCGRDGGTGDKDFQRADGRSGIGRSLDAIIDYASRETQIPGLEGVTAYIQPNGIVLFETPNSNHRTAAHVARGEETMRVDGAVTIQLLKENIFKEQTAA